MEQIRLGQLAQQMGTTPYIKDLGKMMESAHNKSLDDLTALAYRKNIAIPSAPTDNAQKDYLDLSAKTGNDFDKAYADLMVSKHDDAIDLFEKASADCNDTEIKNWASVSLPGLRTHLNHSKKSQEQYEAAYFKKNN
jgi:putative membrane protein